MKLVEPTDDQKTVRLGIVKLGTAVGKTKYALIDEVDIQHIHNYKFDARLEIDRNGEGLRVLAMGHPKVSGADPIPLQNILWANRYGQVEPGFEVRHLNGITMDNRMDNLTLVPKWITRSEQNKIIQSRSPENIWERERRRRGRREDNEEDGEMLGDTVDDPRREDKGERRRGVNSLYWKAITQLLANESDEQRNAGSAPFSRAYYTTEGELISRDSPSFYFFECHFAPCTAIETEPREFAMCGRCQGARYCSRMCQKDDWAIHRDHCNEVRRGSSSGRALRAKRRDSQRIEVDR